MFKINSKRIRTTSANVLLSGWKSLTIFAKSSLLDIWLGCEYVSTYIIKLIERHEKDVYWHRYTFTVNLVLNVPSDIPVTYIKGFLLCWLIYQKLKYSLKEDKVHLFANVTHPLLPKIYWKFSYVQIFWYWDQYKVPEGWYHICTFLSLICHIFLRWYHGISKLRSSSIKEIIVIR